MRSTLITAFLLVLVLAGCSARSGGAPTGNLPGSDEPAGEMPSLAPVGEVPSPAVAEPAAAPTADTTLTPFKLKNWVDICEDESGHWQEGVEGYQPVSYGGTNSYSWKLGQFQAELYQKVVDDRPGYDPSVDEYTYTTSWTLPDTITPGTTIRIPVTGSGKHVASYAGRTTEKTWDTSKSGETGWTGFSLYIGAAKSKGGAGYDISSDQDFDDQGYVEWDIKRGAPVNKVLEIRVEYICNDIIMGKIYYYER